MLSQNAKYLLSNSYCKYGEEPEDVYRRVVNYLFDDDVTKDRMYNLMTSGTLLPNSPCIHNSGNEKSILNACFVLPIDDDIGAIFDTVTNMAKIFHYGGGVGINFSPLREKDSPLKSGGTSSGVVSFMNIFDSVTDTVKQGGYRRGALMGCLDYSHPEIFRFINAKLKGRLQNFNISVCVDDLFMNCIKSGKEIPIISPKKGVVDSVKAKDIFDVIAFSAWSNGDPGLLFLDTINNANKLFPEIRLSSTNPCQPADSLLLDNDRLRRIDEGGKTWTSWKTGIKEVFKLTLNNGMEIKFTPDHKIMLDDDTFVLTKDAEGKSLKWGLGNRETEFIDINQVLRGFLFGDGSKCGGGCGCVTKINEEKEFEVSKFLDKTLPERDLPDDILFGNSCDVASFLRGLFEANGSVNNHSQISLKSTCKSMLLKVQLLLSSFGIPSWLVTNKSYSVKWKNGTYISKESYNLQIAPRNSNMFRKKIGFISERKNSKIREFERPYDIKLKVKKIESLGEMEVWDYKMNFEPHYNLCQGIIAHNCGEMPLPSYGACCLGSINLGKFVRDKVFNYDKFVEVIHNGMKMLDAVNKKSWFPIPEITETVNKLQSTGLGWMGFADALIKMEIYYDSQECLDFIDSIGKVFEEETDNYDEVKRFTRRSIAPTGSLSILANCSSGIEPIFDSVFERHLTVGVIEETRDIYKSPFVRTAHQVSPEWHVRIQAQIQKWIDSAVSKTVNLPHNASVDDVKYVYMLAWELGCKGVTIFRYQSKDSQVLYSTKKQKCSDEECYL